MLPPTTTSDKRTRLVIKFHWKKTALRNHKSVIFLTFHRSRFPYATPMQRFNIEWPKRSCFLSNLYISFYTWIKRWLILSRTLPLSVSSSYIQFFIPLRPYIHQWALQSHSCSGHYEGWTPRRRKKKNCVKRKEKKQSWEENIIMAIMGFSHPSGDSEMYAFFYNKCWFRFLPHLDMG